MKKYAVFLTFTLMTLLCTSCVASEAIKWKDGDHFVYQGDAYEAMDFSGDIFWCDATNLDPEERFSEDDEDEPMYILEAVMEENLFYNGTLYCREETKDELMSYYRDDANFDWFVELEEADLNQNPCYSVEISPEEIEALYEMDSLPKKEAVFLDDAQQLGALIKTSKDDNISGLISILLWQGDWYWQTEIIDESVEEDGTWPTYIQPLPQSLSRKINKIVE